MDKENQQYSTYIIKSQKDKSYYIGYSADCERRLLKHNTSKSGYTSTKKPWELVFVRAFSTKREAIQFEKNIKAQKSRSYIVDLIASDINELARLKKSSD